jgi:hypothetical protein
MPAALTFIHAHRLPERGNAAPLSVHHPRTIATDAIVRIFQGPRFVTVETADHRVPFNGTLDELVRDTRKMFPSVHLQTEDGWQLLNLRAISAILTCDEGRHDVGLVSRAVLRIGNPQILIDLVSGLGRVERIQRGRSFWTVPVRHVIGLDNGTVFVTGGHQLQFTEPSDAIERRLSATTQS